MLARAPTRSCASRIARGQRDERRRVAPQAPQSARAPAISHSARSDDAGGQHEQNRATSTRAIGARPGAGSAAGDRASGPSARARSASHPRTGGPASDRRNHGRSTADRTAAAGSATSSVLPVRRASPWARRMRNARASAAPAADACTRDLERERRRCCDSSIARGHRFFPSMRRDLAQLGFRDLVVFQQVHDQRPARRR